MALIDSTLPVPSARTVRAVRRGFERARMPRARREGAFAISVLAIYVVGGLGWWFVTRPSAVVSTSFLVNSEREWSSTWAWVLFALLVAAGSVVVRALGPVSAGRDTMWWLLSAPVDRRALMVPRVVGVLAAGAVVGALGGRLAGFAGALESWLPFGVFGSVFGVGLGALAVLTQCGVLPDRVLRVLTMIGAGAGGVTAVFAVVGTDLPMIETWFPVAVTCIAVSVPASLAVVWCGRISLARMAVGSDMSAAARVAANALDMSVLTGIVDERAWRRVARCPSRRLPATRLGALIRVDALRCIRRPHLLGLVGGAVSAGWILAAVLAPVTAAWAQLALVFGVAMSFSGGLRELCDDAGLRAMLGGGDRMLRLPLMVVPGVVGVVVAVATVPLVASNPILTVVALTGALWAVHRVRTSPHVTYDGLILETGYGQVPVDLIRQKLRGADVLAVTAALLAVVV